MVQFSCVVVCFIQVVMRCETSTISAPYNHQGITGLNEPLGQCWVLFRYTCLYAKYTQTCLTPRHLVKRLFVNLSLSFFLPKSLFLPFLFSFFAIEVFIELLVSYGFSMRHWDLFVIGFLNLINFLFCRFFETLLDCSQVVPLLTNIIGYHMT